MRVARSFANGEIDRRTHSDATVHRVLMETCRRDGTRPPAEPDNPLAMFADVLITSPPCAYHQGRVVHFQGTELIIGAAGSAPVRSPLDKPKPVHTITAPGHGYKVGDIVATTHYQKRRWWQHLLHPCAPRLPAIKQWRVTVANQNSFQIEEN